MIDEFGFNEDSDDFLAELFLESAKLDYADNPEQALGLQSRIKVLEGSKCLTLRVHHDVIPEAKRLLANYFDVSTQAISYRIDYILS